MVKGLEAEGVALDDDDGEHVKRAGGMRARLIANWIYAGKQWQMQGVWF